MERVVKHLRAFTSLRWLSRLSFKKRVVGCVGLGVLVGLAATVNVSYQYRLGHNQMSLLTEPFVATFKIKQTATAFTYNFAPESKTPGIGREQAMVLAASKSDTTAKEPYQATLPKDLSQGIHFANTTGDLGFTMTPKQAPGRGQLKNGFLIYPGGGASQHVYTFKRNGIKEDIILNAAPGNTATYTWKLDTKGELEAKLLGDGSIGFYSADPTLFGDIKVGDTKTQALIDNAKKKATKSSLAFVIPRPYMKSVGGKTNYTDVSFSLAGGTLTLTAKNLKHQSYPLTIDPTVVVTTTGDFRTGADDGSIDYGTAGQINRGNVVQEDVSGWKTTNTFTTARTNFPSVAYGGYIYILGGGGTNLADVQYAPINSDGSLGTWATTTSFTTGRQYHAAVAYNGYMYVLGGSNGTNFSDVQYAPINSNGTIGTWTATTSFTGARISHQAIAYNGYMYVLGGNNGSELNDVQYAPINSNGTVGTWTTTTSFTGGRQRFIAAVYNGNMYVVGGGTAYNNDVQFASIATNGVVGSWTTTSSFTTGRHGHAGGIYNGYVYIAGGISGGSTIRTDVQYAPINSDGTVGPWTYTSSYTNSRYATAYTFYNGHFYILGGYNGGSSLGDTMYAPLNTTGGILTGWVMSPSAFTTGRLRFGTIAANGYLYILGGSNGGYLNDVQYAPIYPDGHIGTWTSTYSFTNGRYGHAVAYYNGYIYIMGGYNSGTIYADVQYAPVMPGGGVGVWSTTTSIPAVRYGVAGAAYNGYLYVIGGNNGGNTNTVYYAPINANGTIGVWATTSSFTNGRSNFPAVAYNGYMYIAGGSGGSTYNDVQYAIINSNGTLGSWTATTSFTNARQYNAIAVTNGYFYLMGGQGPSSTYADVQYASINGNGTLNSFTTSSGTLSGARWGLAGTAYNGVLYALGGFANTYSTDAQYVVVKSSGDPTKTAVEPWTPSANTFSGARSAQAVVGYGGRLYSTGGTTGTNQNDVQVSTQGALGGLGSWSTTTSFATARSAHTSVAYNGYLYVIGGYNGSTYQNDVQYAPINTDGTIGTWNTTTSFGTARSAHTSVAYNGYLYVIGGYNGSTYQNDVQYAPINTDGTIGTWNTTTSFTTARSGHSSVAYNGYLYVIGGTNGSNQSDVQYAAINSGGTIGTWNTTTALSSARSSAAAVAANGNLYIIGGRTANYLTNVEYAHMNSNGTIGSWVTSISLDTARSNHAAAILNGYVYVLGGTNGSPIGDTQQAALDSPSAKASYERLVDIGTLGLINSVTTNGQAVCGYGLTYRLAASDGVFGAPVSVPNVAPGSTVPIAASGMRYVLLRYMLDDEQCGTISSITDATVTYTYQAPSAPLINIAGTIPSAPSLRNYATAWASSTAPTITIPATTQGGDGLYIVTTGGYNPSSTAPTGWTTSSNTAGNFINYAIYYRTAAGAVGSTSTDAGTVVTLSYNNTFDVETAIYDVANANGAPVVTSIVDNSSTVGTLNTTAATDDLLLYYGAARQNSSGTVTLSGGTTDQTRSSDTNMALTIGHASPAAGAVSQTFTPNSAGVFPQGRGYFILQLSRNFTPNTPPPQTTLPTFQVHGSQVISSYLRYKLDICGDSLCSGIVRTIDQTASQTGWSGQDQQTGTAYASSTAVNSSTFANHTYQSPPLSTGTQYWYRGYSIDPASSNLWSAPSDIGTFTTNGTPAPPVLLAPISGATGLSITPEFRLSATENDSDYVQYKIDVCSTSNCSSIVRTIDQTASQTGWQGQSQQSGTAYAGDPATSQIGIHQYQSPALGLSTQYWWRAYAIDPAGTNAFSAASGISSFTTAAGSTDKVRVNGGTIIRGGTKLGQ